jgi:hypothetical protein
MAKSRCGFTALLAGSLDMRLFRGDVQPQVAAAMEAAVLSGLQQVKQQQQLYLKGFHTDFAGRSTDALLQELPSSLTQLDLYKMYGTLSCGLSSSTVAAFTRLRSL